MAKFTMDELTTATFPIKAFQVQVSARPKNQKGVICKICPVTLTGIHEGWGVTVVRGGQEHTDNPLFYFRSEDEAQKHIDAVYSGKIAAPTVKRLMAVME